MADDNNVSLGGNVRLDALKQRGKVGTQVKLKINKSSINIQRNMIEELSLQVSEKVV